MRSLCWLLTPAALVALLAPTQASAYCRTRTKAPPRSSCPEPCVMEGDALFWASSKLTYTLNDQLFPNLSEAQVRGILRASFGSWEQIQCPVTADDGTQGYAPIGLEITAEADTTSERAGHSPSRSASNKNVIFHLSAEEWASDPELPREAFAVTSVWFNEATGEILGADMQFNGILDPYGICPFDGCVDGMVDLQNVATHEAGHFLGLAHSEDESSTMSCDASRGDVNKRSLGIDDINGMCAAYPYGASFQGSSQKSASSYYASRCSLLQPGQNATSGVLTALISLGLLVRRRRARP